MLRAIRKFFIISIAAVVAAAFLFFAMVNREMVALHFTPFPLVVEMRLFAFVALLTTAGMVLGWVVASMECRRRYLVKKETSDRLRALEDEVKSLRLQKQLPDHSPIHTPSKR